MRVLRAKENQGGLHSGGAIEIDLSKGGGAREEVAAGGGEWAAKGKGAGSVVKCRECWGQVFGETGRKLQARNPSEGRGSQEHSAGMRGCLLS